jgi:hypothetical protein
MKTPRSFRYDSFGVSLMYDAVLFLVMVSLAGVILLPALQSPVALESSVDKHREEVADEALHTFLVSRADLFEYLFCGDQVNAVAEGIGINTSSTGLYRTVTHWLLSHEQRHKTYAALLAEDLACQFHVPVSLLGINRLNLLTTAFDGQLKNETEQFLSTVLGDKYRYNLTAWWHPIKGISFGGEFSIGPPIPSMDTYVARSILTLPYLPVFSVKNHTIIFTKYALTHQLFSGDITLGHSSIPAIANIILILENYSNGHPPFDTRPFATAAVRENLSVLLNGFLIYGLRNETSGTVFPGIINMTLTSGFEKIKNITRQLLNSTLNASFGALVQTIDTLFSGLNTSANHPFASLLLEGFNTTFHTLINGSFGSFDEMFDAVEIMITEQVREVLNNFLDPYIDSFVDIIFNSIDLVKDFTRNLIDWLFDRISLVTAEVTLTVWVVRE